MPSVHTNKLFYIPKEYPSLTLEKVDKALAKGNWASPDVSCFDESETFPLKKGPKPTMKDISKKADDKIQVRVLSPVSLEERSGLRSLFSWKQNSSEKTPKFDTLIIHLHGGGWCSMTSGMHQIYLREWCQSLGLPIFSIDYTLSPKAAYPTALDECWQAYNWLIDNSLEVFGIKPTKVILVGDSAGGNMAIGLSMLAIKSKRRVPDGLVLAYPALNLSMNYYTPSLLKTINDDVVPYSFLQLCLKSYLPNSDYASVDPLVSPILASEDMLRVMPPIRMFVGTEDALHDDCWRFLDKLVQAENDVRLIVYQDLVHGMLNHDILFCGFPECGEVVKDAGNLLKELIDLK